jgi:hypothetical protein
LSFEDKFNILRNHVVDNPNFLEGDWYIKIPQWNLKNLLRIAIIHWYMPEEIRYMLHLDLQEKKKHYSLQDQILISQFLISKERMILFLKETQMWHSRDFFGNILGKDCNNLVEKLRFKKRISIIRKTQRKRGYHDHGSRVLEHIFKETRYISRTKELKELEDERLTFEGTLAFLEGMLI